jgi:hypothetical protein
LAATTKFRGHHIGTFFLPPNQKIVAVLQSVDGPPFINKIIIKLFSKQFVIQKISKKQLNFIQSFYFKQN